MIQKFSRMLIVLCIGLAPIANSMGQAPQKAAAPTKVATPKPNPEVAMDAIRKEVADSVLAFNKKDAKAAAAFWTKEGEFIDDVGRTFLGREAIEKLYEEVFASSPEVNLQLITESVRLLSDGVAIEDGQSILKTSPSASPSVSKYTAVHMKVESRWLLASVRETAVDTSSNENDLADLNWLIGDWSAEENGQQTESKCRWIVNGKFVERSYSTTQLDGTVITGMQIIGWNSQSQHVQSWSYSADGGHAVGVWSATEDGWLAKVTGTTGQGVSTTAVNILKRLDDNAYVWQSLDRTIGELRIPDTDEVVIRRKQPTK